MKRSKTWSSGNKPLLKKNRSSLKHRELRESCDFPARVSQKQLAELENVSISYGSKTVCENVSFTIEQGERIALSGKTDQENPAS